MSGLLINWKKQINNIAEGVAGPYKFYIKLVKPDCVNSLYIINGNKKSKHSAELTEDKSLDYWKLKADDILENDIKWKG